MNVDEESDSLRLLDWLYNNMPFSSYPAKGDNEACRDVYNFTTVGAVRVGGGALAGPRVQLQLLHERAQLRAATGPERRVAGHVQSDVPVRPGAVQPATL